MKKPPESPHLYDDGQSVQAEAYRSGARKEQPERHGRHEVKVLAELPILLIRPATPLAGPL